MTDLQSGLVWGWLVALTIWLAVETRRRIAVTDRLTTDVDELEAAEAQVETLVTGIQAHQAETDAALAALKAAGADPTQLARIEAANAKLRALVPAPPAP